MATRFLLGLLDPNVAIVIAELDENFPPTLVKSEGLEERNGNGMLNESWKMLDWVSTRGELRQRRKSRIKMEILALGLQSGVLEWGRRSRRVRLLGLRKDGLQL
jgi:hypothetical protein